MPTASTTTTSPAGGSSSGSRSSSSRSSTGGGEGLMSAASTSPVDSSFRFVPAFCLGVVAAVVFQLAWGGLTLTSFFLKLFIYVSFALLCFLAGSFVLLVRKSPLKVSCFDRNTRQSAGWLEFFNKLMVRHWCLFSLNSLPTVTHTLCQLPIISHQQYIIHHVTKKHSSIL